VIGNATSNGRVSITGIGANAPERVMKNDELAQIVDTSDEWIVERTGIRERRVATPDEALSDLARPAAEAALEQAGLQASAVDLIVVATVTPDMLFPSTGAILADQLGAKDAAAYDLSAGCTGFVYAIAQAHGMVASGLVDHALVVGGDVLSKIVDWEDRSTCVLFGDGAGAVVLQASEGPGGLLGVDLFSDGAGCEAIIVPAGGAIRPASHETVDARQHTIRMLGSEVYKYATRQMGESALAALRQAGLTVDDVDQFVFHQANLRIISSVQKQFGIPDAKTFVNIEKYGNTSAASVPMALVEAVASGRIAQGDRILMVAFGGGYTAGGAVVEWTADPARAFLAPGEQTRMGQPQRSLEGVAV
jgi:3-oxoacyl-[acyl-carrier-protein] synthase III